MHITPGLILQWIEIYKYWILFPASIFEGPIITIIAGFLVSIGKLRFLTALSVVVLGDLVGDSFYYLLGRKGRGPFILKIGKFIGIDQKKLDRLERHFEKHSGKTIVIGKLSHAAGTVVLVAAGLAKVDYWKFMFWSFVSTVPKSLLLLVIGYFYGSAYARINGYLDRATLLISGLIILVLAYFVTIMILKKRFKQEEE